MNVLFLTMVRLSSIEERGIYADLMREFRNKGHQVYIVSAFERRLGVKTALLEKDGVHILGVRTLNVQKTNVVEKGIGQVTIEFLYRKAINRYFQGVCFDLILYSTPPITFSNVIRNCKKKSPSAKTYLLLKDIFPQNAVDMGMMTTTGIKGRLYRYFRNKEKKLYSLSDYIGCMSPANVRYVISHNREIDAAKVEVAPNSIELRPPLENDKIAIRRHYGLPDDKPIFVYGGNLGKPQGIPFLLSCLEANINRPDCYFLVVGNGTEYAGLEAWVKDRQPENVSLIARLPKEEYDKLVQSCDVGLIFLDYRFTIPNYPSRLLSYLENRMPVIVCSDKNSDAGAIAEENGYGVYCPSNSVAEFTRCVDDLLRADRQLMGEKGYDFLKANYLVEHTYNAIMSHFKYV